MLIVGLFQVLPEVFLEMQSKLSKERREPTRHEKVPGTTHNLSLAPNAKFQIFSGGDIAQPECGRKPVSHI